MSPTASPPEITEVVSTKRLEELADQYAKGKQLFSAHCIGSHFKPEINRLDQYTFDRLFERLPAPAEEYLVNYYEIVRN